MTNICDLRHQATRHSGRYLALAPERVLVLTVHPEDMLVCPHCPNLHIRVLDHATPTELRDIADGLNTLAAALEAQQS